MTAQDPRSSIGRNALYCQAGEPIIEFSDDSVFGEFANSCINTTTGEIRIFKSRYTIREDGNVIIITPNAQ